MPTKEVVMEDWRKDYVCCVHVTAKAKDLRHQGMRVCCEACYQKDFLTAELEVKEVTGGLVIGHFKIRKKKGGA